MVKIGWIRRANRGKKGMLKMTDFLIAIIFVSVIISIFGLFMGDMNKNYGVAYDNTSLKEYNKLSDITNLSSQIKSSTNVTERTGLFDIMGGYFTDAYNTMKLTAASYNVFNSMTNKAVTDANLGIAGNWLRIAIGAALIIAIFLGIIISAIVKRDL